jgi:hypothetical protein
MIFATEQVQKNSIQNVRIYSTFLLDKLNDSSSNNSINLIETQLKQAKFIYDDGVNKNKSKYGEISFLNEVIDEFVE